MIAPAAKESEVSLLGPLDFRRGIWNAGIFKGEWSRASGRGEQKVAGGEFAGCT